ncbi:NUDIX domain-containing protein [Jutongia hominis]|jgi:nucleoside triphosphatase|uniref:NUDIX hydrolase n=1 Tax=Jutongia hominis TaxID=2763664 RepID=A0ABR7MXB7_9FIRM|nr:NUDIX hydrolase [Jutongia hominis]MBC8558125.1 NUDIX hydrolase [Jutongia hominis]MEE0289651.1 NUDIX hydrolase [Lachnospiraceae bacterium]
MANNRYRILVKGIVQKDNKFLIVEKWYDDNIVDPYQWEFVDGEAEFGESPDAAVVRIIQEQTGLTSVVDRILYTWTFMIGSECNLGLSYLCLTDMDEDTVVLSEDLNNAKWIEADEIEDYINNKRMIEDLKNAELY